MQLARDLHVGAPPRHEGEDLFLPLGQGFGGLPGRPAGAGVGEGGEQAGGDVRRDERVAGRGGVHGLGQQRGTGVLEEEPARARTEGGVHVLVEVEGGDDDHRERIGDGRSGEGVRRLDAVHAGHAHVEQAHVGAQAPGELDGAAAVGGLAGHLDARLGVQDHGQPGAHDLLVVGDDHAYGHEAHPVRGSTAVTVQPRPGSGPARQVPPSRVARSAMPASP